MTMKMKMVALAIAFCSLVACKKNNDNPPSTSVYEQNIGNIKKNEPVLLTFSNSDNMVKVNWTVTPSTGVVINAVGNTATITFSPCTCFIKRACGLFGGKGGA